MSASQPLLRTLLVTACLAVGVPSLAQDFLALGTDRVVPGGTAMVPVVIVDRSGNGLGEDTPLDRQIQGFSVAVTPAGPFVTSVAFTGTGVLDGLTPLHETTVSSADLTTWLAAFDGGTSPISFTLDEVSHIGVLSLGVSALAPLGTVIGLTLDPARTAISNQGGSIVANADNLGLSLVSGAVVVDSAPLFEDGFEAGTTAAWSATSP